MGIDLRAGHIHRDRQGRSPAPAHESPPSWKKALHSKQHLERALKGLEAPELTKTYVLWKPKRPLFPSQVPLHPLLLPGVGHPESIHTQLGRPLKVLHLNLCPRWLPKLPNLGNRENRWKSHLSEKQKQALSLPAKPTQVMSPNLGQGLASGSTQEGAVETELDPAMARAILQSWSETKGEDGTVQRTYTQCAQEWPLSDLAAFENIEKRH